MCCSFYVRRWSRKNRRVQQEVLLVPVCSSDSSTLFCLKRWSARRRRRGKAASVSVLLMGNRLNECKTSGCRQETTGLIKQKYLPLVSDFRAAASQFRPKKKTNLQCNFTWTLMLEYLYQCWVVDRWHQGHCCFVPSHFGFSFHTVWRHFVLRCKNESLFFPLPSYVVKIPPDGSSRGN